MDSSPTTTPRPSALQEGGALAAWHAQPGSDVLDATGSAPGGLTDAEARSRLARHGPNTLPRVEGAGPLLIFWRQLNNPLIWVLIGAAAIALLLGKVTDGLIVLAAVALNTLIGFVQEYRASRAIEALASMVPEECTIVREGGRRRVPVSEVVPGDIFIVSSGDRIPADARLLEARGLRVDESALTGESLPVDKAVDAVEEDADLADRVGMTYGGTLVSSGTGRAVVVATGAGTELGRISSMLRETVDLETPLTHALGVIGRLIAVAILVVSVVLLAIGTVRAVGNGAEPLAALSDSAVFAIALAVGSIPEGLPAIVTIALAIGVQRMARRRAVIRRLPAVETLGSTTVICSDKTGTLTRNEMTVQEIWTPTAIVRVSGVGYRPEGAFEVDGATLPEVSGDLRDLLLDGALCSDASLHGDGDTWTITGDPTEGALVVAAEKAGVRVDAARQEYHRSDVIPFESEHQYMAVLVGRPDGGRRIVMKGAPETILARCTDPPVDHVAFHAEVDRLAAQGMRVLAVAHREPITATGPVPATLGPGDVDAGFELDGLIGMIDPPRPEAVAAVAACRDAGITVKMITGDHAATAEAIGEQLGLGSAGRAFTGARLAALDGGELRRVASTTNVFARVAPEHKLGLVRALQAEGQVVAMTGDGVNDAPALRQANIGIAMGITGTAVSREAADVVLTDDNFATIAAAVEEGRRVYDNLVKALAFILPTNLSLGLIFVIAVAFFPFDEFTQELLLPMQPAQLLWINMATSVALGLPLAFEAKEPNVMRRPPRAPDAPILGRVVIVRTALAAVVMAAGAIGLFIFEYFHVVESGVSDAVALGEAQTMAVTTVVAFQVFYLLNSRSLDHSLLEIGLFSNWTVWAGIGALAALQLAFVYLPFMNALFGTVPLPVPDLLLAIAVGVTILPVISAEKWVRSRLAARRARATTRPA